MNTTITITIENSHPENPVLDYEAAIRCFEDMISRVRAEKEVPAERDPEDEKALVDLTALLAEARDMQERLGSFAAELEDILDMLEQLDALEKSCSEDA